MDGVGGGNARELPMFACLMVRYGLLRFIGMKRTVSVRLE